MPERKTDELEYATKEELNRAIKSVYRRSQKDSEKLTKDIIAEVSKRVDDNCTDLGKMEDRVLELERSIYPLETTVASINKNTDDIKETLREGFKDIKDDIKEFKSDIKEEVKTFTDEIDSRVSEYGVKLGEFEKQQGWKSFFSSTQGVFVAIVTSASGVVIALINLLNR